MTWIIKNTGCRGRKLSVLLKCLPGDDDEDYL